MGYYPNSRTFGVWGLVRIVFVRTLPHSRDRKVHDMSELQEPTPTGISRRTVTKAMAWAVPVVAIAAPVPAFAASGGPPTGVFNGACKLPGNACGNVFIKGYVLQFTLSNNTGEDVYLYNQAGFQIFVDENINPDITLVFQAAALPNGTIVSFPYLFPANSTLIVILNAGTNENSAQSSIGGTVSFPWGHNPTPPDPDNHPPFVVPFFAAVTPPEQNPSCTVDVPC